MGGLLSLSSVPFDIRQVYDLIAEGIDQAGPDKGQTRCWRRGVIYDISNKRYPMSGPAHYFPRNISPRPISKRSIFLYM
jgi:hypothetical protein